MPLPRSILTSTPADVDLEVVAGAWPDGMSGDMFVSGPDPGSGATYALFGSGLVHRLTLVPGRSGAPAGRLAWRVRPVRTPSARVRERMPDAFGGGPVPGLGPLGMLNAANTAPLPWGDRTFVTWDVGRPVEIDPLSLEFLGEVGHRDQWTPFMDVGLFPFVFSSAHPVVDPDRDCLWTVQLVPAGFDPFELQPWVVRWDGSGTRLDTWPIEGARITGTMHTTSITENWIVYIDSGNFKNDPGEASTGNRTVLTDEDEPVFLVRKDDLESTPPGEPVRARSWRVGPAVGHYYACYDDSDGVRVLLEHMENLDLGFHLRGGDIDMTGAPVDPTQVGMYNMAMSPARVTELVFDPETGAVTERAEMPGGDLWNQQLNAMDWSVEGMRRPTLHHMLFQGWKPTNVSRRAWDLYEQAGRVGASVVPDEETPGRLVSLSRETLARTAEWEFGPEDQPTSPIFVPREPGADSSRSRYAGAHPGGHDGWVVVPVLSDDRFRVEVFDAANVGAGPEAVAAAPPGFTMPFLLHAAWHPGAGPAPRVERLRFRDEIGSLERVPAELRPVVEEVAAELERD